MAKRKKDSSEDLLSQKAPSPAATMPSAPATPQPKSIPKILEYTPLGSSEEWRVERFEDFAAEVLADCHFSPALGTFENIMVWFHEIGLRHPRQWLICRKLFGIGPMIIPGDSDPEDFEIKTRPEVCALLQIKPDELQAELDAMRAIWQDYLKREKENPKDEKKPLDLHQSTQEHKEELEFGEGVLREFGFDEGMFNILVTDPITKDRQRRTAEATRIEKNWFSNRVKEWSKMLREPMAGALAREALINELYLRRLSDAMVALEPSSARWKTLYADKKQIETQFKEQLTELQGMFPESATMHRERFRWVLSELIKACQEYYGRSDRRLIDKIFAAAEVEVMVRQSLQATEPRYRWGLNAAIIEAMNGLYDPNWRSQVKLSVWKKMDAGFKEGVMKMREALNEPLVDLEKGVLPGEGEEFEDLKLPEETETEMTEKLETET